MNYQSKYLIGVIAILFSLLPKFSQSMEVNSKDKNIASSTALFTDLLVGGENSSNQSRLSSPVNPKDGFDPDKGKYLDPDSAFTFSAEFLNKDTITARWNIASKYYLYRNKFKFVVRSPAGVVLGDSDFPTGQIKNDEYFGQQEVFYNQLVVDIPVLWGKANPTPLTLEWRYQGCTELGLCYPPITKTIELNPASS
jgi:thiol:disulfide interchange protein